MWKRMQRAGLRVTDPTELTGLKESARGSNDNDEVEIKMIKMDDDDL